MKYYHSIICSLFLFFSVSQVNAESSWWEKTFDLFSPQQSATTQEPAAVGNVASNFDLNAAFKEALQIGATNVVSQLGRTDGFNADSAIHIPLPEQLQSVKEILSRVGMASIVDDLELKLNRAAESATPQAKALFLSSIKAMTFDDVKAIYAGSEDSATQYFKTKMSQPLSAKMRPIVQQSLSQVGAVKAYDRMMGKYADLPFVSDVKVNLTDHVVENGINGIFYYLAKEESAIRQDPLKQTSTLLKKVFGQ
ncbi:MAG: hypothetical protein ACJAT7_001415 [Psychromonas sp.]|jgi:hypothetical protein|uniref:DUF4197 domain-containing protein n=1 Tax=Psychromonas sp. TaxID=1884585 RepID=UPI0039E5FB6B